MLIRLGFMLSSFVSFEKNHTVEISNSAPQRKLVAYMLDDNFQDTSSNLERKVKLGILVQFDMLFQTSCLSFDDH